MESHRNGTIFVQQVLQQSQSELEQTEVTAVATMDNAVPAVVLTERPQINDPDVGQAGRHQHAREARGVYQMRCVEMEATTFLVREKGFDPKPFGIHAICLVCRGQIRE